MKLKKITAIFLAALLCICTLSVSVSAAKNDNGITLNKTSVSVAIGKTVTLKATAAEKSTVTWSTSDKSVATVSQKGVVTGKKTGTATITVKIKGTKQEASCTVKVVRGKKISSSLTGAELVKKLKSGVNLGNTLDCHDVYWIDNPKPTDYETAWGNVMTTEKYFTTVKKAGFNVVRIPVSWGDHIDSNGNINKDWLDRVQEVVDYAYDNGLYVILNTHHEDKWLQMDKYDKKTAAKFENLWKQIAKRFKNYDERLILEGMNEPRTVGSEKEWSGGTSAERQVVNKYNKLFIEAVRASGGNNAERCLMITTYGGSSSYEAINDLEIPNDDKIIVTMHSYYPYVFAVENSYSETKFTNNGKAEIDDLVNNVNECLIKKGVPVIFGEFGSNNKSNTAERVKHTKYYVDSAKKIGVPCLWWDNGGNNSIEDGGNGMGLMNRKTYEWYYPELVEAITGKKVK